MDGLEDALLTPAGMPELRLSAATTSAAAPVSEIEDSLSAASDAAGPPGLFHGRLGISDFEIRYAWAGSESAVANELAASATDLLIMQAQYQINLGADQAFTPGEVAAVEAGGGGKMVIGYMSIGAIDPNLDRFASLPASASFEADGKTYLKYWDPSGDKAYNPVLLKAYEGWIDDLATQGFNGAFLDVMDSYTYAAVQAAMPGATTEDDYLIGTTALLNIIKQLGAYDAVHHPGFQLVLGNNPFLITHYYFPGADPNPDPDAKLVAAVQKAVAGDLLESVDFSNPNVEPVKDILQDLAPGSPYGFGDATLLSQSYASDATFTNGDPATRTALEAEIDAARFGVVPYGAPSDTFGADYPQFGVRTSGPDAMLAIAGGARLYGAAGDDVIFGQGGADSLLGGGGSDEVNGAAGDDTLSGGRGQDQLTGGDGQDDFVFTSLKDSTRKHPDLITDLTGQDRIDLSAIDADTTTAGDQAFVLVKHFDHHAGEAVLSYDAGADLTRLSLDVNGDGKADMVVTMTGDQSGFTNFAL